MKRGPTVPAAFRRAAVGVRRGPGGPVGTPEGPVWVRTSIVHRYGTVERSVEPRGVPSCQNRVPTETRRTRYGLTEPDEPRRIIRLSRIGVRLIIRTHTGPYGTLRDPDVPSWDPMGPNLTTQTPTT